jgi:hypothetical protein
MAGVDYGYKRRQARRLGRGRQVLLIRDSRSTEHRAPTIDDNLFDDWRLPLTAEVKKRMKADVARLLRLMPNPARPSGR